MLVYAFAFLPHDLFIENISKSCVHTACAASVLYVYSFSTRLPVDDAFRLPSGGSIPSVLSSVPHPSEQHSLTCCNNAAAATRSDTSGIALALPLPLHRFRMGEPARPRCRGRGAREAGPSIHAAAAVAFAATASISPSRTSLPPLQSGGEFRRMMRKNIFGLTRARAHSQAAARNVELLEQGCLLPCPNGGIFLPFPTEREGGQTKRRG